MESKVMETCATALLLLASGYLDLCAVWWPIIVCTTVLNELHIIHLTNDRRTGWRTCHNWYCRTGKLQHRWTSRWTASLVTSMICFLVSSILTRGRDYLMDWETVLGYYQTKSYHEISTQQIRTHESAKRLNHKSSFAFASVNQNHTIQLVAPSESV